MDNKEIAYNLVSRVMSFLSPEAKVTAVVEDNHLKVDVTMPEAGFVIGHEGENLRALQHVLALIMFKKTSGSLTPLNFIFDINNYNKEKEDYLIALAKNTAHQVLETSKAAELEPMSAFERRLIHLAIENIEGVQSESVGVGENRRVTIKPRE